MRFIRLLVVSVLSLSIHNNVYAQGNKAVPCLGVHQEIEKQGFVKIYHKYINTPKGLAAEALYRQKNGRKLLKYIVAPENVALEGGQPMGMCYTGDPSKKETLKIHLFYILEGEMDLVTEPLPKHRS